MIKEIKERCGDMTGIQPTEGKTVQQIVGKTGLYGMIRELPPNKVFDNNSANILNARNAKIEMNKALVGFNSGHLILASGNVSLPGDPVEARKIYNESLGRAEYIARNGEKHDRRDTGKAIADMGLELLFWAIHGNQMNKTKKYEEQNKSNMKAYAAIRPKLAALFCLSEDEIKTIEKNFVELKWQQQSAYYGDYDAVDMVKHLAKELDVEFNPKPKIDLRAPAEKLKVIILRIESTHPDKLISFFSSKTGIEMTPYDFRMIVDMMKGGSWLKDGPETKMLDIDLKTIGLAHVAFADGDTKRRTFEFEADRNFDSYSIAEVL